MASLTSRWTVASVKAWIRKVLSWIELTLEVSSENPKNQLTSQLSFQDSNSTHLFTSPPMSRFPSFLGFVFVSLHFGKQWKMKHLYWNSAIFLCECESMKTWHVCLGTYERHWRAKRNNIVDNIGGLYILRLSPRIFLFL